MPKAIKCASLFLFWRLFALSLRNVAILSSSLLYRSILKINESAYIATPATYALKDWMKIQIITTHTQKKTVIKNWEKKNAKTHHIPNSKVPKLMFLVLLITSRKPVRCTWTVLKMKSKKTQVWLDREKKVGNCLDHFTTCHPNTLYITNC